MNAMLKVFRYELIRNIQRRGYLFTTFGIPLLGFVLLFGYQFITDMNKTDEPATDPTEQLEFDFRGIEHAGYIDKAGVFGGIETDDMTFYADEQDARASLATGDIDVLYIIEPDYVETGNVRLVMPEFNLNYLNEQPVRKLIFEQMGQTLDRAKLLRLQSPVILNEVHLQRTETDGAVRNEESNMVLVYFFSLAFLLTVFGTSGYLMQSVIEEKENRVVEILITSIRPNQLLTGKVLALGVLGLFQVVVWLAAALFVVNVQGNSLTAISALTGLRIPLDALPLLLTYFVLGYLLFAAAFGAIGAVSNSLQEGPQIALVFTLPAVIPFYIFPVFIESPDAPLPVILSLFPVTAPLSMVMRSVVTVIPAWQIALSILLLALSVVAMFWMAGRLFRVNTLLSGKVPKIRDIPRLIFGKS